MLVSKSGWLLLSFFAVVAVLALWNELPAKLRDWQQQSANAKQVAVDFANRVPDLEREARHAAQVADDEIVRLKSASDAQLVLAESTIVQKRSEAQRRLLDETGLAWALAQGDTDKIVASYKARYIELPLLDRTAGLITLRRANWRDKMAHETWLDSLGRDISRHIEKIAEFNARRTALKVWQQEAEKQRRTPACEMAPFLPGCSLVRDIRQRTVELRRDRPILRNERVRLEASKAVRKVLILHPEQVADSAAIVASATKTYHAKVQSLSNIAGGYTLNQASAALKRYGWLAFWIVLSSVLLPILYKLFAFLIIAPLAPQARPVQLGPTGPPMSTSASGMSVEVSIHTDSELLLRSGLQSSGADIRGDDKWVLDWRMLFTCVAAGLINLQRLRSDGSDLVGVIGVDNDHRVAAITVPAGGAVVLHPRALLGVVKLRGQPLVITRPWRVRWLISWITTQFRYIVFHGPCTLIVQGRGGVQEDDPARGRMINKRLTLGFDAGLAYGAARSASFLPYLRGQASLFNDRFEGVGRYLYEQRAAGSGKGSVWGRGLKGIGDAVLNALGI